MCIKGHCSDRVHRSLGSTYRAASGLRTSSDGIHASVQLDTANVKHAAANLIGLHIDMQHNVQHVESIHLLRLELQQRPEHTGADQLLCKADAHSRLLDSHLQRDQTVLDLFPHHTNRCSSRRRAHLHHCRAIPHRFYIEKQILIDTFIIQSKD